MKANEAPEKIYLALDIEKDYKELERDWYIIRIAHDDIEYTRTDAFIEKAAEYLSYHLDTSKIDVNYKFDFIEEFKKAMKL